MAFNNSNSVTEIEEQIAKITAELEKARALQYANAEKVFLAAQKRADIARTKVNELTAKAGTTVAAQSRLALAKAAFDEQEALLGDAEQLFNVVKEEQDAADEFAKNVALVLSGKKLGKKIKFSKKEKAVIKEDKKAAKKLAKQEKKSAKKELKAAKQQAKDDKKKSANIEVVDSTNKTDSINNTEAAAPKKAPAKRTPKAKSISSPNIAPESIAAKEPLPKESKAKVTPAKKAAPAKKAPAKKPAQSKSEQANQEQTNTETLPVPASDSAQVETATLEATNPLPPMLITEDIAKEEGHDTVVESQTLPPAENPAVNNDSQKPIND